MDIQRQTFGRRLRGFDREEVRAYLNIVAEEVAALQMERDRLDQEVQSLIEDCHAQVTQLLTEHRGQLDDLSHALLAAGTHGRAAYTLGTGVQLPALIVSTSDSGLPVGPGSDVHYTVTVRNVASTCSRSSGSRTRSGSCTRWSPRTAGSGPTRTSRRSWASPPMARTGSGPSSKR